jgi:hypothetical protein
MHPGPGLATCASSYHRITLRPPHCCLSDLCHSPPSLPRRRVLSTPASALHAHALCCPRTPAPVRRTYIDSKSPGRVPAPPHRLPMPATSARHGRPCRLHCGRTCLRPSAHPRCAVVCRTHGPGPRLGAASRTQSSSIARRAPRRGRHRLAPAAPTTSRSHASRVAAVSAPTPRMSSAFADPPSAVRIGFKRTS